LNVRASFSESVAFLERDINDFVDTFHQHGFNYGDSYRIFGGWRALNCCAEIQFAYARYRSDAAAISPQAQNDLLFIGPLEVNALLPGDTIQTQATVDARTYDLDIARTIPLGSPFDPCKTDCCWCPAWDVTWFAGLRYADVGWINDLSSFDIDNNPRRAGWSKMDFHGGGLRWGMQGRRYFGRAGHFSLFARGTINLLLGDVKYSTLQTDVATPGVFPVQRTSFKRIIPVTEIEAGASVHICNCATISAGYLMHAWHDLGMGDSYDYGLQLGYDDANILGFEGGFVRAEIAY
jgi:hypothetical protein